MTDVDAATANNVWADDLEVFKPATPCILQAHMLNKTIGHKQYRQTVFTSLDTYVSPLSSFLLGCLHYGILARKVWGSSSCIKRKITVTPQFDNS